MHSVRTYLLQALADPAAKDAAGPETLTPAARKTSSNAAVKLASSPMVMMLVRRLIAGCGGI
jgi:hypothetical protein